MNEIETTPILRITSTHMSVDTRAVNSILDKVGNRPFALISINGLKRTGKSFIMNKFVHYLKTKETNRESNWFDESIGKKDFRWQWEKRGITMLTEPVITQVRGKEVAILLMETQGDFYNQFTRQLNAAIFAFSALLSSVLIFNTMKDIGEDSFQFLHFFSEFAKMASSEVGGELKDADVFQKLVFLMRDMELSDFEYGYYDQTSCPPGQSLNFMDKVTPNASQPTEVRLVREHIHNTFKDIGIYTLPFPGRCLTREDSQMKLEDDFKAHTINFVELMLKEKKLQLKTVGGVQVTGKSFQKYVNAWAKLFHSNDLPALKSIFETAAEMQGAIAMSEAVLSYENDMKLFVNTHRQGVPEEEFTMKHLEIAEKSFTVFRMMKKIGGVEYETRFIEELEEKLEQRVGIFESINNEKLRHEEMRMEFLNKQSQFEAEIRAAEEKLKNVAKENVEEKENFTRALSELHKSKDELAIQMEYMTTKHNREMDELRRQIIPFPVRGVGSNIL